MPDPTTKPLLTLAQVAERLQLDVDEKRIRALLVGRKLCAYVRIRGLRSHELRVDPDTLEAWIRASESDSTALSPHKARKADF